MNPTDRPYLLYGFEVSFFTAKVRVAIRYKQLCYALWMLERVLDPYRAPSGGRAGSR